MSGRFRRAVVAACACAVVSAGCGVATDTTPVDLEQPDAASDTSIGTTNAVEAIGAGRIYLLAPDLPGLGTRLEAVARDTGDSPAAIIDALLAGPSEDEFAVGFRSLLPPALRVNDVALRSGGVLAIDLSSQILDVEGDDLPRALAQIVHSVTAVPGITEVMVTVDGTESAWPVPGGELVTTTLTVHDFPGLIDSAQPAYPATPSPADLAP